ncbi:carcinine transporter isoform X2 [Anabrus simplex]|uniref:carcinine transporter isoform X2 n=1 Tax=Anabrus simplex TaxID=316456 RepID=UPI0035A386F5
MTVPDEEEALFDELMKHVGTRGKFQKRFNLTFNLVFSTLVAMPFLNFVLAMAVPNHWCHVPGREKTNYTHERWLELNIPREEGNMEVPTFSKCHMYNRTWLDDGLNTTEGGWEKVACQHGWEYDQTWYRMTAPTQEDWVCDKELYVTNVFVFGQVGDVVGTFIFGQLGDIIGRRPNFFISIIVTSIGHCLLVVSASIYPVFLTIYILGSSAGAAAFQSPLALSMEVSDSNQSAHIAMLQCLGWTTGMCIMPMIAWATGEWRTFILITSIPCALFIFLHRMFPESPRWLAAMGKPEECLKVLRYIASVNGTSLPHDTMSILKRLASRKEQVYGIASLFTGWRLVMNTFFLATCRTIGVLTYYTLVLNVSNMSGNPFLNFLWQSMVELPGFVLGRYLGDKLGRRWTQAGVLLVVSVANFVIVATVTVPGIENFTIAAVVFIRFCTTIVNYIGYLQSMEMYPTCIRQTGTAVGNVAAGGLAIIGPYIVYLGTSQDVRYPYAILGGITLMGSIMASFLPETLYEKLPETLHEAQQFGRNQRFWSRIHKPVEDKVSQNGVNS